jgi:hypothetical protein
MHLADAEAAEENHNKRKRLQICADSAEKPEPQEHRPGNGNERVDRNGRLTENTA